MSTVREQASARVQAVDKAFSDAIGAWSGVSATLGELVGITPQSQVLNAIRQMQTLGRDPWVARRDKLVDNDQAGWDAWIKDGNDLLHNLASTAQDADSATLTAVVAETVVATKQDVQVAAKSVWDAKYVLAALAIAVVLILYKVRP
jgi:hypothetical protein